MGPEPLLTAARRFSAPDHLRNVMAGEWIDLHDETGRVLVGIRGRPGAFGMTLDGQEIGADLIEMSPGSSFPLHVHPGDHLLYIVAGYGIVHVDRLDRRVREGDTIFIAAEAPHGVRTDPSCSGTFAFLAVGVPHKHVSAIDRMRLVEHDETPAQPGTG